MNLLIVDDQAAVVRGLLTEIDWPAYGIQNAFGAYSVAGAIDIFNKAKIDVLLCDIEMPIESGLSLVQWVNKQKLDTRCILLTAHAQFDYAQQSVRLHVFDYILQPAPYSQIAETVKKAVEDLSYEQKQQYFTNLGETFSSKERNLIGAALHNWLSGYGNTSEIANYSKAKKLPDTQMCIVALIHVMDWDLLAGWTLDLLDSALDNVLQEIFSVSDLHTLLTPMTEDSFLLIIWPEDASVQQDVIKQQIDYSWNIFQRYLQNAISVYWCDNVQLTALPQKWELLLQMKKNNVAKKPRSIQLEHPVSNLPPSHISMGEINTWTELLTGPTPQEAEQLISSQLNKMSETDHINAANLIAVYQGFLQAFYNALAVKDISWQDVLESPEDLKIYAKATDSVDQLKKFVHLVVCYFVQLQPQQEEQLLQKVNSYIDVNMEHEISRQDLANAVFLNADYLNRLIRNATGMSLKKYISQRKMNRAMVLLQSTHLPVAIIASKVGFPNSAHFTVVYKKYFGKTPMQTRSEKEE